MGLINSMSGMVAVRLTGADIPRFLATVNAKGLVVHKVVFRDYLTVDALIHRKDYREFNRLATRCGAKCELRQRHGIYWSLKGLLKRPVLMIGAVLITALTVFIPTRVLFVQVEGNAEVPAQMIVDKAQSSGIYFGASRRSIRSERIKNDLLSAIPQLQWVGVNTRGCVAVISVRERVLSDPAPNAAGVSSSVAARDGIIKSCTVTKVTALCKIGQAVKEGEVLVSGYTDCGLCIRATRSEAEIYAQTDYDLAICTPSVYRSKGAAGEQIKKFSLIIGKNRINFYKDSGISGASCDKMYLEYPLVLPGGFQLPVVLVEERWIARQPSGVAEPYGLSEDGLSDFAKQYLREHMVAGKILTEDSTVCQQEDIYCLRGLYTCLEMIGRVQEEEFIKEYGKSD